MLFVVCFSGVAHIVLAVTLTFRDVAYNIGVLSGVCACALLARELHGGLVSHREPIDIRCITFASKQTNDTDARSSYF